MLEYQEHQVRRDYQAREESEVYEVRRETREL
jgi:hypothetical protein